MTKMRCTGASTSGTDPSERSTTSAACGACSFVVSEPASIHYVMLPVLRRDDVLNEPRVLGGSESEEALAWWRVTDAA